MKTVYCSKCNTQLTVSRIALKKFGRIIDTVPPHDCPEEPLQFDFPEVTITQFVDKKFVQKSNELRPPSLLQTPEPGDRRPKDQVKDSSAPVGLIEQMRRQIDGE